jgi:hypothetical protein
MKLRFNVFGYEIARIDLDIEREETPIAETLVNKVVSETSRWWTRRMFG